MKKKLTQKVMPFVIEFITFLFFAVVIAACLIFSRSVTIRFNLLVAGVLVVLLPSFLFLFFRVVNTGAKALFDSVFKKTKTGNYVFIETQPFKSSIFFAEKNADDKRKSFETYYLIHASKDGKTYTFLSPEYIDLTKNEEYTFTVAATSHILIDFSPSGSYEE